MGNLIIKPGFNCKDVEIAIKIYGEEVRVASYAEYKKL